VGGQRASARSGGGEAVEVAPERRKPGRTPPGVRAAAEALS
jgi:hypothetical protein